MSFFNDPRRIPEAYGLRIAAGLIAYFILMKLLNLAHNVELRLLNLAILVIGVYFALKKLREVNEDQLNYFRALITGFTTATIGSVLFAIFLFVYMKVDSSMMQAIIEGEPMGRYLNAYIAAFIVALEGVFSGLLVTFVILNYIGTDEVNQ
ncbi:MAG TPA: DUF4199 domain-containing protein [Cyclobacteriaceae bacterium]|nr:DUF4199 domain-containing protein [Cyclobacteriaceae bacterium]